MDPDYKMYKTARNMLKTLIGNDEDTENEEQLDTKDSTGPPNFKLINQMSNIVGATNNSVTTVLQTLETTGNPSNKNKHF